MLGPALVLGSSLLVVVAALLIHALAGEVASGAVVLLRGAVTAAVLLPWASRARWRGADPALWLQALTVALALQCFAWTSEASDASVAVALASTGAAFALLLDSVAARRWPRVGAAVGVIAALTGAVLLRAEGLGASDEAATAVGLLGAFLAACTLRLARRAAATVSWAAILFAGATGMMVVGAVQVQTWRWPSTWAWAALVAVSLLYLASNLLLLHGLRRVPTATVSVLQLCGLPIALGVDLAAGWRQAGLEDGVGAVLIVGGAWLASRDRGRPRSKA